MLDFARNPAAKMPWIEVVNRWTPSAEEAMVDERALEVFIARLAADGLWLFDSMDQPLTPEFRRTVAARIATMIKNA